MGTVTSLNQTSEGVQKPEGLLSSINTLVGEDMAAVDRHIQNELRSDVALIEQIGHYIVGAGGKRLRPVTCLLYTSPSPRDKRQSRMPSSA